MLCAALVRVDGEERLRGADEQAATAAPAEGQVRDREGHLDLAEQCTRRIDAVHTVTGTAPDVAVLAAANDVGVTRGHRVDHPDVSYAAALVDIEQPDMPNRVLREL